MKQYLTGNSKTDSRFFLFYFIFYFISFFFFKGILIIYFDTVMKYSQYRNSSDIVVKTYLVITTALLQMVTILSS